MKNFIFLASITIFLLPITIQSSNQNLIHQTCKQTPYFDLCVSSLESDPRSTNANLKQLARIMVDLIVSKSTHTLTHINDLIRRNPNPKMKEWLNSCADAYKAVLMGDVPQAIEALEKGNYKFAEQGTNDAANEADSCERRFRGRSSNSPLFDKNKGLHDVSTVTASIVRLLLNS